MKRWISIGENIIDPEFFYIFYIENIPSGKWVIFAEDKNKICWRLLECNTREDADMFLRELKEELII